MLRGFIVSVFIAVGVLVAPTFAFADAFVDYDSLDVEMHLNSDGSLDVIETFDVRFKEPRHGIYRVIPIEYKSDYGLDYHLRIDNIEIIDGFGESYMFTASHDGGDIVLKIGNPEIKVEGNKTYEISYTVNRAIRFFDDYDELYWNILSSDNSTSIENVSYELTFAPGIEVKDVQCFTGLFGGVGSECDIDNRGDSVTSEKYGALLAFNAYTVDIMLAKGGITDASFSQKLLWFLKDNWGFLIPLIVFFIMHYLWRTRGKDPQLKGTIIAQYEPYDDLTPIQVGTLIDEMADPRDLSAEIVHLAVIGYLKIEEDTKKGLFFDSPDYVLILQKENFEEDEKLKSYQKIILRRLFVGVTRRNLSALKNTFYIHLDEIYKEVYQSLIEKGYFSKNPKTVRNKYFAIAFVFIFVSFIALQIGVAFLFGWHIFVGVLLSGIIIGVFGYYMPRKTRKGADAYWHSLGFEEYLRTAERYRLKFQEKENIFEMFLPYAMALSVADKWGEAFEGIYKESPKWYSGGRTTSFSALHFAHGMNSLQTNMSSALTTAPRSSSGSSGFSSGGGFSGGGFGGGSVGSW